MNDQGPSGAARLPAWAWPLLALPVVAVVGLWAYRTIASDLRRRVASALETMLASDASALDRWLPAQANLAERPGRPIRACRTRWPSCSPSRAGRAATPPPSRPLPPRPRLRAILAPVAVAAAERGLLHLDPGGIIVARIVDERVGDRTVLAGGRCGGAGARRQAHVPAAHPEAALRQHADGVRAGADPRRRRRTPFAVFAFRIHPAADGRRGERGELRPVGRDLRASTPTAASSPRAAFEEQVAALGLLPAEAQRARTAAPRSSATPAPPGRGTGAGDAPEHLAADVVGGGGGGRAIRRERGRLPQLPRGDGGGLLALASGVGHRARERDRARRGLLEPARRPPRLRHPRRRPAAGRARPRRLLPPDLRPAEGGPARAQRLGQYTLEDKIGEGGHGRRLPRAPRLPAAADRDQAHPLAGRRAPRRWRRFEREVQLTSALTHPNTIAVYDYGRTAGRHLLLRDGVPARASRSTA